MITVVKRHLDSIHDHIVQIEADNVYLQESNAELLAALEGLLELARWADGDLSKHYLFHQGQEAIAKAKP